jgi:hypothetical protein
MNRATGGPGMDSFQGRIAKEVERRAGTSSPESVDS